MDVLSFQQARSPPPAPAGNCVWVYVDFEIWGLMCLPLKRKEHLCVTLKMKKVYVPEAPPEADGGAAGGGALALHRGAGRLGTLSIP